MRAGPAIGVHLFERGPLAELGAEAARMEELGFAAVTVSDHLRRSPTAPLLACAAIAAATERARFGPLVLNNDLRHPVVLAREAAVLHDLSDGRFDLGLGSGYARAQYERAGIPFHSHAVRAARLAESARVIRGLLAGETIVFEGEHYTVRGESLDGARSVPLLLGGNSPEVHAAAAAYADIVGLIGFSPRRDGTEVYGVDFTSAGLARLVERLRELAGPRLGGLGLHVLVQWHEVTDDLDGAAARAADALEIDEATARDSPYVLLGSAPQITERIRGLNERFGITRWTVFGNHPQLPPGETFVPVLERLADA